MLGPPGVGKGTQAEMLSQQLHACHLSTGDVFRAAAKHHDCMASPALAQAIELMHQGKLVPDGLVFALVAERTTCLHCSGGFILDGFPRSLQQANDFDALLERLNLQLDAVVSYTLSIEETINRVSGRLTCSKCHTVYHLESKAPATPGICDRCGNALTRRHDDHPEAIRVRLQEYAAITEPLVEHCRQKGNLLNISAASSPAGVLATTLTGLYALAHR
ncbi:MAG: nucleoside monophosphate kinase [Phycisphaerales bacterium]|nr:nucleoside monophosphate kinase [Phycisphaerales bacterium]